MKNSRRMFLRSMTLAPIGAIIACRTGNQAREQAPDGSAACELTGSDIEGPFHLDGAPSRTKLASDGEQGSQMWVSGKVLDASCTPIVGATLDIWHADDDGKYHDDKSNYRLRGQLQTDESGTYKFETIRPGRYLLGDSYRPAHIHFIVSHPDFVPLTTQLYFEGDPYLGAKDPCGNGCNASDPTLIRPVLISPNDQHFVEFEIVLQRVS